MKVITMEAKFVFIFLSIFFSLFIVSQSSSHPSKGGWKLLKRSIGISAMHIQLLPNDRIITFDRTDLGSSNISLPKGKCRTLAQDQIAALDCSAHSVEFNPANRNVRPLTVLTDTWCSSGALAPDGVLVQSGGFNDGDRVVRYFKPCDDCDWMEDQNGLVVPRWYASNHILPNGKIIVVGGRGQFNYEFIPKSSSNSDHIVYELPFLKETKDSDLIENNLYPFIHLSTDGNLFIFANNRSMLFDYTNNRVVRNYPAMPGGVSRNYPSTGSSVLLPLKLAPVSSNGAPEAEVLICGGTPPDSFAFSLEGTFLSASKSCGRLMITAKHPRWEMEEMPIKRVMGDMVMLPTGDVLIINGAETGTAGWYAAREPVLNPVLYHPNAPKVKKSSRFEVMNPSKIARMYHSTAHLIPDGRVLVGGSNPNANYNFTELFPTELSMEAFSPPYLSSGPRPKISWVKPGTKLSYKQRISIGFESKETRELEKIYVTMVAPSFNTHSFSMNQRLMVLDVDPVRHTSGQNYVINGYAPATAYVAPPGYYLLFVVHCGVPSRGKWIHIS